MTFQRQEDKGSGSDEIWLPHKCEDGPRSIERLRKWEKASEEG